MPVIIVPAGKFFFIKWIRPFAFGTRSGDFPLFNSQAAPALLLARPAAPTYSGVRPHWRRKWRRTGLGRYETRGPYFDIAGL
ncbi:MAG: hypothetical protein P4L45_03510, partial [Ignavibacteriaceae bacterium]|nr:hypothetical protein [Ignavibacteriaceae bacterium]